MIIYVLEHMGGLSHLLTIRLLKHREEKSILAVVLGDKKKRFLPKLVSCGLFDYVFESLLSQRFISISTKPLINIGVFA